MSDEHDLENPIDLKKAKILEQKQKFAQEKNETINETTITSHKENVKPDMLNSVSLRKSQQKPIISANVVSISIKSPPIYCE